MRILLVDDSRTMRSIEKNVLSALGDVEFVEVADGLEALMALSVARSPFDLVLVDWNMPHLSGGKLVGRIRETDKTTPLIMVTTETERTHVLEALKAGANDYVIKPFKAEMLLERVTRVLHKIKNVA